MPSLICRLRSADEAVGAALDGAFPPAHNPWRHLGGLAFLCLVISVFSGIIAYALYDTSVSGAYSSGLRLQQDPLLLGRLLRGMHRYAADAFMLLSLLHVVREAARGHFLGVRWFSWISGVPLLWLLWIAGVTGFWLLWDARALFSINATAEWLQALPLFSDQLVRNFLTAGALNDRFFSLIVFMHIGVPLFLLAGVWIHVQRMSGVRIWPPRTLTWTSLGIFAVLALLYPAQSLSRADTGQVPATVALDWFYLFLHPLVDAFSASTVWGLVVGVSLFLLIMPWLPVQFYPDGSTTPLAPAVVNLPNCNGCSRCAADCPFGAIAMVPRSDQLNHHQQASVNTDLCASCGICVGSCPSSTPFRSMEDMVSGIELPDTPVAALRKQLQDTVAALTGPHKVVLFSCRQAADWQALADASTAVMPLECAAMLPPSFTEYAVRLGAQGVVIAGCREADCEFRLGDRWVRERFAGEREPRLRAAAPRERITVVWAGNDQDRVQRTISLLRAQLPQDPSTITPMHEFEIAVPQDSRKPLALAWLALGMAALLASGLFSILLVLSRTPQLQTLFPVADFFRVALVVHVDLSVLVWFLAFGGALWTMGGTLRFQSVAWVALALSTAGTLVMCVAPFVAQATPIMANYVPVLDGPVFLAGLVLFGAGITLLCLRSMGAATPVGSRITGDGALRFGLNAAMVASAVAALAFAWSWLGVPRELDSRIYYEMLFWGGGHVLQFAYTLLMLVCWIWLASAVGARLPISPRIVTLLFAVALLSVFLTPITYLAYNVTSVEHHNAQTLLMRFGGGLVIPPIALAVLWSLWPVRLQDARLRPLRTSLIASLALFSAGGVIGFLISGSNVRIPAHYHGCIVGVTLAMMGVVYHLLPRLGFSAPQSRATAWQPYVYGVGQLMHIIGLVWSGGYGVQRKVAGADQVLRSTQETLGMGLMGLGGLIAIVGGIMFVVIVIRSVRQSNTP